MSTCEESVTNNTMNQSVSLLEDRPMIGILIIVDDYRYGHDKLRFYVMNETSNKDNYDCVLLPGQNLLHSVYYESIYNRDLVRDESVRKITELEIVTDLTKSTSQNKYKLSYDEVYYNLYLSYEEACDNLD